MRRLGYIALGAVVTQGILGGITVLWFLPDPISIAHASLAQTRLLSDDHDRVDDVSGLEARVRGTRTSTRRSDPAADRDGDDGPRVSADPGRRDDATYGRGARNPGLPAGVRASDSAELGPEDRHALRASRWRAGGNHLRIGDDWSRLLPPSIASGVVAAVGVAARLSRLQITLGALTVLSHKHYIINSLHVVTGASVLATSLVLALRAHRGSVDRLAGSRATRRVLRNASRMCVRVRGHA